MKIRRRHLEQKKHKPQNINNWGKICRRQPKHANVEIQKINLFDSQLVAQSSQFCCSFSFLIQDSLQCMAIFRKQFSVIHSPSYFPTPALPESEILAPTRAAPLNCGFSFTFTSKFCNKNWQLCHLFPSQTTSPVHALLCRQKICPTCVAYFQWSTGLHHHLWNLTLFCMSPIHRMLLKRSFLPY